jgi:3-oxoacyl-[acyl-carrier protein] reductase
MSGLVGQTALVTGAGRGIGRYTAQRLARDGARVGVHYGTNEAAATDTVAAIEAAGGSAFVVQADLAKPHARRHCGRRSTSTPTGRTSWSTTPGWSSTAG